MAIDSLRKRASIASLGLAFLGPSVVPDGTLGVEDRQTIANSYYGIDSTVNGVTIGGTSQLGAFDSTGGITLERTIGGTAQLLAFDATGGITLERTLGGTSQLAAFTSSGFIQVGDVVAVEEANTGGWAFRREQERYRQEDEARKRRAKKEKAKQIADKLDRDIALAFIARDEGEAQRKDLERLTKLAAEYKDEIIADNAKIASTIEDAVSLGTFSRMQKLSRELNLMREEEQFLMLATKILLEQ